MQYTLMDIFKPLLSFRELTLLILPKRLLRLGLSMWMICDMVFDAMQIRTYWTHGNAHRELVYFYSASAAWFLPPLIYLIFSWFFIDGKGIFTMLMRKNFGQEWQFWRNVETSSSGVARCNQFVLVLGIPAFLLIDLAKAILMVYVYIPTMDMKLAFSEIIYGSDEKRSKAMPGLKLFEQFGEAVPQIIIAIAFLINVKPRTITIELQNDSVKLTSTLVSILLSLGSILIGVAMGIKSLPIMRTMMEKNTAQFNAKTTSRKVLERQFLAIGGLSQDIVGSTTNLAGRAMRRLSIRRR